MKGKVLLKRLFLLVSIIFVMLIITSNKSFAVNDINIGDKKDDSSIQAQLKNGEVVRDYVYELNPLDKKIFTKKQKDAFAKEAKASYEAMSMEDIENNLNATAKYTTWANCRKKLQKAMVKRTKTIKLYWKSKTYKSLYNTVFDLYNEAVSEKYAYSTDLGDYMNLTHAGWSGKPSVKYSGGYYKYYIVYTMKYKTTYAQEKKLNAKIKDFKKKYKPEKKSNFEKIYDIHEYICDNVTYDHYHQNYYKDSYLLQYTAYAALMNKTAVCQGYATLYYKMLKECGINCRVITSYQINHAWNYIKLSGKWYFMDVTWDDGNGESNGNYMTYFMKGTNDFYDHSASDYSPSPYSYDYATTALDLYSYRIDISNPTKELKYYQYTGSGRAYDGTLTYHGSKLRLNKDYRIDSCYNNTYVGTASAQITGIGKYKGTTTINYYIILPAPQSFYTTEVTDKTATLYWGYDYRSAKYIIKNTKTKKIIKEVTGTNSCTVNLSPATKYDLSVQAVTYVSATGEYKNSSPKKLTLYTKPSAVSGIKASKIKNKSMKLTWNKVKGANGYKIYIYDTENYLSWSATSKTNSYSLTGLTPYTTYNISIQAYTNIPDGKNYGEEGYLHEVKTTINGTSIKKLTAGKKKVTITWNASNSSDGYILYMKTGKKGKYKKIKEINNNSTLTYTKTKLKKGTTYYFKMRTYKIVDGKKVYSYYCGEKSVKAK